MTSHDPCMRFYVSATVYEGFLGIVMHVAGGPAAVQQTLTPGLHPSVPELGCNQRQTLLQENFRTSMRPRIQHQQESGEAFAAERSLQMNMRKACETLLTGGIWTRPSCWRLPVQTRRRWFTCEVVVLLTIHHLPLPPRHTYFNTGYVQHA